MQELKTVINYDSSRAQKARLAVLLEKTVWRLAILGLALTILVCGAGLAVVEFKTGLLIASFAVWPLMIHLWNRLDLKNLKPNNNTTLDGLIESNLLGRLPRNPSPKQMAEIVVSLAGGHFFVTRFGLGPAFVRDLSSDNPEDSAAVWESALVMKSKFDAEIIDAAMVFAALIDQIPNKEQLLARLQLDSDDILAGVGWFEHIRHVASVANKKVNSGGIGRDWSFGYTPLLSRFAQNLSDVVLRGGLLRRDLEGHRDILDQIVRLFSEGGRRNAVLVGPTGVGKTTLVYALAEKLMLPSRDLPKDLHYRQVMALDPASLIAQARGRGELEGLLQQVFVEALKAKNVVLFLDDAQLFMQDGTGSVDLSNLLIPILEGGALRIVMAMDEQVWLRLSQSNPALMQFMNRVNVAPLAKPETMLVLEDQLLISEYRHKVVFMYQALNEVYKLSDRYVQDQAMPGKAINLLESAAQLPSNGYITTGSVQQAIEKTYGVKVANAQAADERQTLLNLEQLIHQRMINQTRAVSVVSNALRRARTGVRNPNRPIGTFMFLGPTGVGKTELAKSLAAIYFGGENRLVRLDLNEFGQAQDVNRLLVDGAKDPNSLVAQISKQPFSVVLLDEIEKAHPNVLNTLLQLLDEGILRDINNKPVSFRDAIVIATSNAGADKIREYIKAGQELEQFEDEFVDALIDSGQFRPEFLNRFDEIVVFRPLKQKELVQVIDLMLASINKTMSTQKISLSLTDEAKQLLAQTGYDPRLGARPLRRVVQRTVEDIIARRMLSGEVTVGSTVQIGADEIKQLTQNGKV